MGFRYVTGTTSVMPEVVVIPPEKVVISNGGSSTRPVQIHPQPTGSEMEDSPQITIEIGVGVQVLKGEDQYAYREAEVVSGELLAIGMVADGHGGKVTSRMLQSTLIDTFLKRLRELGVPTAENISTAGSSAFLQAHALALADETTTSGSTLTLIVVNSARSQVTTLHVGDSVARLVPRRSAANALCEDHRIDSSEVEQRRVLALGGQVARATDTYGKPGGPLRCWPGGVAQARAIGDRDVGKLIDANPAVLTVPLPAAETCSIIICSDGVWDALKPTAVDAQARETMVRASPSGLSIASLVSPPSNPCPMS